MEQDEVERRSTVRYGISDDRRGRRGRRGRKVERGKEEMIGARVSSKNLNVAAAANGDVNGDDGRFFLGLGLFRRTRQKPCGLVSPDHPLTRTVRYGTVPRHCSYVTYCMRA